MKRRIAARPLPWLATLLAVYLCAPFIASIPRLGDADWAGVDWRTTWSAVAVSAGSASVASLVILLGGVPLGYLLARSSSRAAALLGFAIGVLWQEFHFRKVSAQLKALERLTRSRP